MYSQTRLQRTNLAGPEVFDITGFVITGTGFVITGFVITGLVITGFVITGLVITGFVITGLIYVVKWSFGTENFVLYNRDLYNRVSLLLEICFFTVMSLIISPYRWLYTFHGSIFLGLYLLACPYFINESFKTDLRMLELQNKWITKQMYFHYSAK